MSSGGDLAVRSSTTTVTRRRWSVGVRVVLLAWWVVAALALVTLGARASSLPELLDAVSAGRVEAVEVVGDDLPPGASGWTTQTVTWRDGAWRHRATVVLASSDSLDRARNEAGPARYVTAEPVARQVHARDAGVTVRTLGDHPESTQRLLGLEAPSWLAASMALTCLLTLGLVGTGAEPWRATRWAWAWGVLLTGPVGALGWALLSGPMGPLPAPRPGARRVTGGWGFLLALVLGSVTIDLS